jgi:hypothetical protein
MNTEHRVGSNPRAFARPRPFVAVARLASQNCTRRGGVPIRLSTSAGLVHRYFARMLPCPKTWIFERASERIVVSRHQYSGGIQLLVIGRDGATRSRSFTCIEDAVSYQQQFESALISAGWMLEELLVSDL